MCPLNMRLLPPPAPSRIPSAFARPSSTCCHWQRRPVSSYSSAMSSAIALLVAREAVHADHAARGVDEPVAVDRQGGGHDAILSNV